MDDPNQHYCCDSRTAHSIMPHLCHAKGKFSDVHLIWGGFHMLMLKPHMSLIRKSSNATELTKNTLMTTTEKDG